MRILANLKFFVKSPNCIFRTPKRRIQMFIIHYLTENRYLNTESYPSPSSAWERIQFIKKISKYITIFHDGEIVYTKRPS